MNPESITGVVRRLTYTDPLSGYFVAVVQIEGKGERSVVGNAATFRPGEYITATGQWVKSEWGPQFKATNVEITPPTRVDDMMTYIAQLKAGVGPGFAKKLADAFGPVLFDVIEKTPVRLLEVKGVGKKRVDALVAAYTDDKARREAEMYMLKAGFGAKTREKVRKEYGSKTVEMLQKNPYAVCKLVNGIGFKTADEAAQRHGVAMDSEFRIRAGIGHLLTTSEQNGSCGIPTIVMLEEASEMLGVSYPVIEKCLGYEIESGDILRDVDGNGVECLFSKRIYLAEQAVASWFLRAVSRPIAYPVENIEASIFNAEMECDLILEDSQRDAIRLALCSNVCVVTGGPGCGKSTITRVLLHVFNTQGFVTALAAPTGKAAKRAAEATNHEAATLHRTYEFKDGKFQRDETNPLDADVLAVDETSMLDVFLTQSVQRGLQAKTRLILIGDADQIYSVGAGKVLADLIDSGAVPCARLTTIFRQAANSDIIRNAHRINQGEAPDLGYREGSDFAFFSFNAKNPKDEDEKLAVRKRMRDELVRVCRDMYKRGFDPLKDVQVYAPMKKGTLGVDELNRHLQQALNPRPTATLDVFGNKWGVGDKVLQLKNNRNKGVFNGSVGFIVEIDAKERSIAVDFEEQIVSYKASELGELTLAFAITIHKAQGSEAPVVIVPIDWSHYMMLRRNLLYTAVTRARKLCILMGDKRAVEAAVKNDQNDDRHTRLKVLLRNGMEERVKTSLERDELTA